MNDSLVAALFVVGALAWLAVVALDARRLLHVLQLEEYELRRFWRWLRATSGVGVPQAQTRAAYVLIMLGLLVNILVGARPETAHALAQATGLYLLAAALWGWIGRAHAEAKKPLVWTKKALLTAALALGLVAFTLGPLAASWVRQPGAGGAAVLLIVLGAVGLGHIPAAYLAVATLVLWPFQAAAKWAIVQMAARRLRQRNDLVVIGVTGSYGKTSTKEILASLLGARYRVCKTTGSVNTPVGIARTVLRGLRPDDQVFVVEMGAYVLGNIRDLARLARPRIGVLTAIGEQHLERFGSVENIARTKYELIEALPADGLAVFNADNPGCRALAARTRHVPVRTYGLDAADGPPDVTAADIRTGTEGTEFTIRATGHGEARVTSPLLGRHNVSNVLAATAVALELGLSLAEIAAAARNLEPVPHRLQLMHGQGGVTVIDDAYNSNPAGARAALAVLAEFPGRKVLVTPGMVELGERLDERHAEFGRAAATVCDYVILVGRRRTAAIAEGARAAGFPAERLFVVPSLKEATAQLGRLVTAGDVVLFENDLPDQYSEE
ncbi:MAG TPA: UDP-N-acetylmuramoyl-tripeptide--D-alanyl-D-alanine ligase [Chloroflexota bacterium]|nr:UDP-N-acetylmuramoyl-tripeptide--D-alanyl-D-alanine ligase [Chloroflexota bacterium]